MHIGSDINKEAPERRAISGDDERLSGCSLTCATASALEMMGSRGGSGCGRGWGWLAGDGGRESVEVCTRLHYPADLVMTAGAQEERSSRG